MTFQPGANLYTQGFGSRPENVEVPHYDVRAPSTSDVLYPIGKEWVWPNNAIYKLLGLTTSQGITTATWVQITDVDGPVESVVGTANQVTVTTTSGTATVSLPSAITTPGSLTTTTTLTGGTGITATLGNIVASAGNITATLGNIAASAGSVSAGTTVTAGTSITATLGNITATNGDLVLNGAGNKLQIHATTAASDSVGTSDALDGASPSQLVVATTAVTASSKIFLSYATAGGTQGSLSVGTITPGVNFQIKSSANGDTSTVNYLIIN